MSNPVYVSGHEDDEFNAFGIDGFNEILHSFISEEVEVYEKRIYTKPKVIRAIVQNATSDVVTSSYIRQILCNIGVLRCGQYVKINGAYWIVSSLPDNNGFYEKAILWKCKYIIRFISPISGKIVEYPTYDMNSTQYGTGELNKTNISTGEAQHLVYVPYNEETILLDKRFRFLMDRNHVNPKAYRITQVDSTSYATGHESQDGLLQWSVIETQFNELTDNKELMVADYYKQDVREETSSTETEWSVCITDEHGDGRLAIGERKRITVSVLSSDGNVWTSPSLSVSIKQDGKVVSVDEVEDNGFTLFAYKDFDNVGKEVDVTVRCSDVRAESSMKITVVNW